MVDSSLNSSSVLNINLTGSSWFTLHYAYKVGIILSIRRNFLPVPNRGNTIIVDFCCHRVIYISGVTLTKFPWRNNKCCMLQLCLYKHINISLILFSKGAHSLLLVWEIDGVIYTQRGDIFLSHIFFQEPGSTNACNPLQPYRQRRQRRLWSAAYPWLDSQFSRLFLNLTAWFSYHVVSFR